MLIVNRVNERTEDVCHESLLEECLCYGRVRPRRLAGLLVLGYVFLALVWLLLSFPLLHHSAVPIHVLHELAFVSVTGACYLLLRRE